MHNKKLLPLIVFAGMLVTVSLGFLFINPQPVNAQCGSQASSCKNCHEIQAEDPVNQDGTDWHQSHAFGDFCVFCHAGNVQSTVKEEAHTGMVDPLANVQAACSSCHGDYQERAEGYASTLGVVIGAGAAPVSAAPSVSDTLAEPQASPSVQTADCDTSLAIVENPANLIDYTKQYEETVLGFRNLNLGNLILGLFILVILFGGGLFVVLNEGWLTITTKAFPDSIDGFSPDNVALLPQIEKIDQQGRQALQKILKKPNKAAKLFQAVAVIDD